MATTKSSNKKTTKKTTEPQKKTSVKKTSVTKKSTASKKPTTVVVPKKNIKPRSTKMESFKPYKEKQNFMEFKITQQTVYWAIIGISVLCLGLWILKVQTEVYAIYDQIDASIREESALDQKLIELKHDKTAQ